MKHFEFTGETKVFLGVTLWRIRATVTFTLACGLTVHKGDEGGWIEKESNLCENAWVYGDARVYGDAQVYGDARVYGDAQVYGNAWVYGDAQVYGDARVSGNARVYGDAQVYGDAWVYGDAQVYGDARVSGNARVYGDARVSGNARVYGDAQVYGDAFLSRPDHLMEIGKIGSRFDTTTFFRNKEGIIKVTCGCFYGSIAKFQAKVQQTHGENKFAKVYMAAAALAELQIDVSPVVDETERG